VGSVLNWGIGTVVESVCIDELPLFDSKPSIDGVAFFLHWAGLRQLQQFLA
jgi:hypothetical protein